MVNYAPDRHRSVDLLRLLAMGMVVLLHITTHGMDGAVLNSFSASWWIIRLFNTFSLAGVNCFVLISGYYLSQQGPRLRKLLTLWLQVFLYSVGIYLVLCAFPATGTVFSLRELVRHALPLLSNQYWFFKYYVLLLLLSPLLRRLLQTLDRKTCEHTLLGLLLLFCAVPSINLYGDTFGAAGGASLIWFSVLYLMGGYLRMWPPQPKPYGWYYLLACLLLLAIRATGSALGGIFEVLSGLQCQYNSPLVVLAAICLFLQALYRPASYGCRTDRVITGAASCSFGVYLFHDHGALSGMLWRSWVALPEVAATPLPFAGRILFVLAAIMGFGLTLSWVMTSLLRRLAAIHR